jgi:hypothetical protein
MPKNGNPADMGPPRDPLDPAELARPAQLKQNRQTRENLAPSHYHPDNFRFFATQLRPAKIQLFTSLNEPPNEAYQRMMVETCVAALVTDFQIALQNHDPCGNGMIDHSPLGLARANVL